MKLALLGWMGGFAGIGVFQALVAEYHRPLTAKGFAVVVVVVDDVVGVVVDVLLEVVLVVEMVIVVLTGVVVVVELEVVVVGGGGLVGLVTTGVGFEVLTAEPFLLLAVTARRKVEPTSAAVSE